MAIFLRVIGFLFVCIFLVFKFFIEDGFVPQTTDELFKTIGKMRNLVVEFLRNVYHSRLTLWAACAIVQENCLEEP